MSRLPTIPHMAALGMALMLVQAPEAMCAAIEHAVPGVLQKRSLEGDSRFFYYLYVPTRGAPGSPVFVTVHGISRNAREHAEDFAAFAERYGVVLVAPRFTRKRFPDYQRLGRINRGERADTKLRQVLDEVQRLTSADTAKVYLFGYSGGGQFVHRYTMAHPDCVRSFVVGAAGWYTFPNADQPFPLGIGESPDLPDVKFEPNRFLAVPGSVLVGERDTFPGTALRKARRVREDQGQSRFERGRRWVDAMNAASAAAGLSTHYTFESLSRSPHSFAKSVARGDMANRVFERLFGPAPQQTQSHRFD